jgi:GTP-binding protein
MRQSSKKTASASGTRAKAAPSAKRVEAAPSAKRAGAAPAAKRAAKAAPAVEPDDLHDDSQDERDDSQDERDEETTVAPAPALPSRGVVAVVGRPNVGKSTIFNRLVGRKTAIVHDEPGVTRDRHYGDVISRGQRYALVDTGGFDPESDDPMRQGIKRQIDIAIAEADVIVCVLDAAAPPTSADHAELALLRRTQKPVIYVANKADNPRLEAEAADLYRLGITSLLLVSALHGRGFGELETAILAALPEQTHEAPVGPPDAIRVAVVGKPNAGKSSLVNRLLGEERLLVDARPGTTRDPIDAHIERKGRHYLLIDTAGIRRKAKVTKEDSVVEAMSVIHAIRAMDRCEVVLMLCDAAEGVAEQDAKILGLAVERGRAVVIALNKLDLLDKKGYATAEQTARDKLTFAPWAPMVKVSAKTGRGIDVLLDAVSRSAEAFRKRVTTGALNRFFEAVIATHPPPTHGGRAPRLFYITQAESSPPLFVVMASDPEKLHFSYQRYVTNQLRETFGFEGVPVRVRYKARRRKSRT